ncbi:MULTISPECIES: aldo/keto reductase [Flavobacteriaceae]|uniref:Putative oxidoreductase, aryl-alcohol dehydrogenase like protein n=1 Tax=Galbibacter orientalis DSM 19592 TaxID=926559 RepID=I3C1V0_9FLAO|nr:aldo/keto reductase [Galbibacter orientalis]EIJ37593.1 putative oxidoreductase, aryl-alcohol dehydrogenase like protein [Galbibacter orientalis DSM 19592]|tara:strand:- start:241 stop:1209 length:969 start_codon:yes stop_codon:yes gene_type:complete
MKKIKIGQTDIEVAPFNLGGNVFGWTLDEQKSFELLDAFIEAGFNFIDTADMYSYWINGGVGGESETIIGKWMKARGNRDKVIIATKVGGPTGVHETDSSRRHILEGVEKSLERLQTNYIDLYYLHYDDEKTPIEETLRTFHELVKAGKVKHIAVSNISPERLRESLEFSEKNNLPKYQALQPLYNLVERKGYETVYAPIVAEYNLTVFPYFALAAGFLTGKYRSETDFSKSPRGQRMAQYLNEQGLNILNALDQIAEKHNTVPATVSLAWLSAQPHIGGPIASATSKEQLEQILSSTSLKLDKDDLVLLNKISKQKHANIV